MHISITGLRPKGIIAWFRFWRYAIPSFSKASQSDGILFCEVKRINGFHCTLTAWESIDHMRAFMRVEVHLKAMKNFHSIATGKTYGYSSESIPTWAEAFDILQSKGKSY